VHDVAVRARRQICRRIAAALHGELRAHSAGKGLGATFTFTVPLLLPSAEEEEAMLAEAAQRTAAPPEDASDAAPMASDTEQLQLQLQLQPGTGHAPPPPSSPTLLDASALRILVAEDDASSRIIMHKLLSRLRARVTCVCDGAAAVEAAAAERFDCIFMDLHMPRVDGLAASAAILAAAGAGGAGAAHAPPRIIALTASCSPEVKSRCAAAGMAAHLSKPVSMGRLEGVIRDLLVCAPPPAAA
jgi:CheY-like chemotaxis protein